MIYFYSFIFASTKFGPLSKTFSSLRAKGGLPMPFQSHTQGSWNAVRCFPAGCGCQAGASNLESHLAPLGHFYCLGPTLSQDLLVAVPCHPWVPRCSFFCSSTAMLSCHFINTVPQTPWRQGKYFSARGPASNIHAKGRGEAGVIGDTPLNQTTALPDSSPPLQVKTLQTTLFKTVYFILFFFCQTNTLISGPQ